MRIKFYITIVFAFIIGVCFLMFNDESANYIEAKNEKDVVSTVQEQSGIETASPDNETADTSQQQTDNKDKSVIPSSETDIDSSIEIANENIEYSHPEETTIPQPNETKNTETKLTIFIDAGHQAKGNSEGEPVYPGAKETKAKVSSGTKGISTGKYEYQLNLEVALKLRDKLEENGYIVIMARETNDVDISNVQRATLANDANADAVIRIHADGSDNPDTSGFSVLIPGSLYISDSDMLANSRRLGELVSESLNSNLDAHSRGIIERTDLSGFNWLKVPGILIEMGFMSNPQEDKKLSQENYQNKIVQAIFEGIEVYYYELS